MSVHKVLAAIVLVLASASIGLGQTKDTSEAQKPTIRKIPVRPTSASSGKDMFDSYCASCHGKDGKGSGPAAPALKTPPPDLTSLKQRNGGQYPAMRVQGVITGQVELPAHGAKEMPVWGPVFSRISQGRQSEVKLRVDNLTDYIKSMQQK